MLDTSQLTGGDEQEPLGTEWLVWAPARFGRALLRLSIVLVPEYLLVVMLIGAFRGWLFPISATSGFGLLVVLIAAGVGTLLVIPTAGEIPILQGLAIAGVAAGPVGALLITLPAVSLPGIAMVGGALGWRTTATTAAMVAVGGLLGAGLLTRAVTVCRACAAEPTDVGNPARRAGGGDAVARNGRVRGERDQAR